MSKRRTSLTQRMRAKTVSEGTPDFVCEDLTGRHEGADLKRLREDRDPLDRIRRLEDSKDKLTADVADMKESLADIRGDSKVMAASLERIEKSLDRTEDDALDVRKNRRERITKLIGAVAGGGALIELIHRLVS